MESINQFVLYTGEDGDVKQRNVYYGRICEQRGKISKQMKFIGRGTGF